MNAKDTKDLESRLRAAEEKLATLKANHDERVQATRRSSYIVSSGDSARSAETRARNESLAANTGVRPIGGFDGAAARGAVRARTNATGGIGFRTSADFDTASEAPNPAGGNVGFPAGNEGDMLYYDGTGWVVLDAPTVVASDPVLRHDGTAPYWEEPEACP